MEGEFQQCKIKINEMKEWEKRLKENREKEIREQEIQTKNVKKIKHPEACIQVNTICTNPGVSLDKVLHIFLTQVVIPIIPRINFQSVSHVLTSKLL